MRHHALPALDVQPRAQMLCRAVPCPVAQAVANKGEPFLSAIEAKGDAVGACLARHSLRLVKFWGPRDMVAQQLPHARWNDKKPPIASFYCYAAAIKP